MIQKNKNKQILNRMEKIGQQMQQTTTQTKNQLYKQGQQLNRIQNKTNQLDKQTDKTKKLSRQIYSFWYYLKDKVTGNSNKQSTEISSSINNNKKNIDNDNTYNKEINKQKIQIVETKQKNQDDILQSLAQKMKIIKKDQKQISQQIDNQTKTIDRITEKTDKINSKIQYSNKLLKKKL